MEKKEELKIIVVGGTTYETRFSKKFERRVPYAPPDPRHVLCVIPGIVRALFIKPGSKVHARDRLMVIEAMKMENDVLAHRDGIIRNIQVAVGDVVARGRTLMDIESERQGTDE
jgi:biotin carboxyl carrier protein